MIPRTLAARTLTGLGAVLALAGCSGNQSVQNGPGGSDSRYVAGSGSSTVFKVAERKQAPKLEGTTLDDKPFKLTDLRGKVVVLNFWAGWCAPCRGEAPALQKLATEGKSSGVEFVGIDIKDGKDNANAFVRNLKITYPSLYDQPGELAVAFRDTVPPQAIPSTIIVDREGRIAAGIIGPTGYSALGKLIGQVK